MADQRNVRLEGMIKKFQVSTGGETYQMDFQVLRFGDLNQFYPLLLGRPWSKLLNVVTDWAKGCITYGSRNNQTNVRTKSRVTKRAEHEVESSNAYSYNSDEETDDDAKNP